MNREEKKLVMAVSGRAVGEFPNSLIEAARYLQNPDACVELVAALRWPSGPICPHCGGTEYSFLTTRRIWKCKACRKQFSAKSGTIFEDSPIPLDKWLLATWLIVNCKNGISSYEIARAVKVTQKSAWFMLHRIRLALANGTWEKIGGGGWNPVEVDETYVGGKPKNMHKERRLQIARTGEKKAIVMGMLSRNPRQVRATVVPNAKRETLQAEILKNVGFAAHVYTDEHVGYMNMDAKRYIHETVNHMDEYVRGQVHTQGIENFWSLLKRTLNGTYVAVEPFHLDRYVAEQVFRYNNRATKDNPLNDADRFLLAVSQISGKRLTYKELTGKVGETSTEPF